LPKKAKAHLAGHPRNIPRSWTNAAHVDGVKAFLNAIFVQLTRFLVRSVGPFATAEALVSRNFHARYLAWI